MPRNQILSILDEINLYLIAGTVLVLPFFFLPFTTDSLEIPKQALITIVTLVLLLLFGLRAIFDGKVTFRRTPLDLGLAAFFIVTLLSTVLSPSRNTSLVSALPLLALVLFTFIVINVINDEKKERIVIAAALISGTLLALFGILQFLKIYLLPYPVAQQPGFSLSGSLLASGIVLSSLLPLAAGFTRSYLRNPKGKVSSDELWSGFFLGTTILIAIGAAIILYQLVTSERPVLLPQQTGLRTALAPLGNSFQSALLGSGPGTYLFNFTQFKDAAINNTNLWNLRFTASSTLFLEIISTLGVLGMISFLFVLFRVVREFFKYSVRNGQTLGVILSLVLAFVFSFLLPFPPVALFLLFVLLALYAVRLANEKSSSIYDVTLSIVAFKKGLLSLEREPSPSASPATDILPHVLFGIYLIISGFLFFNIYKFLLSDITFQRGLVAAAANQAQETYDLQNEAIRIFPTRDLYHRVFSQTNLVIANSIVAQANAPESGGLSQQQRDSVVQLVEQSIQFGRNAATISPLNVVNWENLANVYRALIGFAQNADQFAIASTQQAVNLDPANPVLRLNLGGIYYQLGAYDNSIQRFQEAIAQKQDFANAYYNLGHAYEAKGDPANLLNALNFYQSVRNLVPPGSEDATRIEAEIAALQKRIPGQEPILPEATPEQVTKQEPLKVSTPSGQLPQQKPPVTVEGPPPPATTSPETAQ